MTTTATEKRPGDGRVPKGEVLLAVQALKMHFPLTQGIIFQRQVGAVKAVDGLNFTVHSGETLGLVGESGCGGCAGICR